MSCAVETYTSRHRSPTTRIRHSEGRSKNRQGAQQAPEPLPTLRYASQATYTPQDAIKGPYTSLTASRRGQEPLWPHTPYTRSQGFQNVSNPRHPFADAAVQT